MNNAQKLIAFTKAIKAQVFIGKPKELDKIPCGGGYNKENDLIFLSMKDLEEFGFSPNLTLCHELIHWTGHPNRLNRLQKDEDAFQLGDGTLNLGAQSPAYCTEEMTANFGMVMLGQVFGFNFEADCQELNEMYTRGDAVKAMQDAKIAFDFITRLYFENTHAKLEEEVNANV